MVNINIELPDDVHRRLKLAAVLEDLTLKDKAIALLQRSADEALRGAKLPHGQH